MPEYISFEAAIEEGEIIRSNGVEVALAEGLVSPERVEIAQYFASVLSNLRTASALCVRPGFVSTSLAPSSVLAATNGNEIYWAAATMSRETSEVIFVAHHENHHCESGCTDCALFADLTSAHVAAMKAFLGAFELFDAVEMDEGYTQFAEEEEHGKALQTYQRQVATAKKLEQAVREEFHVSLADLHTKGSKLEMAKWVRRLADRILLKKVMKDNQCEREEIDFAMEQMDIYHLHFSSIADAELVMEKMRDMYRTEQAARDDLSEGE